MKTVMVTNLFHRFIVTAKETIVNSNHYKRPPSVICLEQRNGNTRNDVTFCGPRKLDQYNQLNLLSSGENDVTVLIFFYISAMGTL
jgi:hypothetical protein